MRKASYRAFFKALLLTFALLPAAAIGAGADPSIPIILNLTLIFLAAKLGGEVATRLGVPAVVGELISGIGLGVLFRQTGLIEDFTRNPIIEVFAQLGVILLLFEVGLESTVKDMMKVGLNALVVATIGVVLPIVGGFVAGAILMPDAHWSSHLFLGATLSATSVGITARVFKDLGVSQTANARIVMGAAVIDDVLGLIVLSVVTGLVAALNAGTEFKILDAVVILLSSVGFLVGSILIGTLVSRRVYTFASSFRVANVLLPLSLSFCFLLAYAANRMGLAAIVGAYAAGLILDEFHFRTFKEHGEMHELAELMHPIGQIFAPVFFVVMGAKVDVGVLTSGHVWLLGTVLAVVAMVSKIGAGFLLPKDTYDRLLVGFGMMPRGEVGLIFAGIGASLTLDGKPLVGTEEFSAIILMILATTIVSPIFLKMRLKVG